MNAKLIFSLASFLGAISVILGAFAAHFLKKKLSPDMHAVFEVGVRYQIYHVFALFITGWALLNYSPVWFQYASWTFLIGVILFSGSLYLLSLTGIKELGIITPIGGLCLVAGWLLLLIGFIQNASP